VAALDLALLRRAAGMLPGEHRAPGVGAGTELAQLRPYEPGDDPRQIDPAASARTGVTHVRQHVPERALTTWLIVDVSPSMAFGTAERLKSDVAEGVAAVISQVAVRRGGRLGLITCGGPTLRALPPRGGRRSLASARRMVSQGVAPDGTPASAGLAEALKRLGRVANRRGLIVVVSDFRDTDGWERALQLLAHRHHLLALEVSDPREAELPDAGRLLMVDPETGNQVEADTSSPALREAFAKAERTRRETLRTALRRAGATHVPLSTEGDWLRALARTLA
jgi:uncharacterized protein (DUF58 family)